MLTRAATERLRRICLGITLFWFLVGGVAHFVPRGTRFFIHITPPWVPDALLAVYVSGVIELLLSAALFKTTWRPWAGWGLIGVTIAVSFANIHMWQHPELFPEAAPWVYTARLLLQIGLLWVIWFGTRLPPRRLSHSMSPSR